MIWKKILLCITISVSVLLGSCIDDTYESGCTGQEFDVKVFLKVPAPSLAQTRADNKDDSYYDSNGIYLLVFDGNDDASGLLQVAKASAGSNIFYAKLAGNTNARYVYVVANMQDVILANQEGWNKNGATLGSIKSQLIKTLQLKDGVATNMVMPQPMIGQVYLDKGIVAGTQIGSSQNPIELARSTVKISINSAVSGFGIMGANLMNTPVTGYLFGMPDATIKAVGKVNTGVDGNPEEMIAAPETEGGDCFLYTFESVEDEKPTAVIIKASYLGSEYFYRIDLDTKKEKYALMRNCNYIVQIKSVKKVGYGTAEEARNNPAGNIEYTINVVDSYSRDIISNGLYYLGVSNTEFYYFTDDTEMKDMQIATVTQNAPATVTSGVCTASSGISISENPFPQNNGGAQSLPLKITMDPGVKEGSVTLKLGDLERTIKVYRKPAPESFEFGHIFDDFRMKEYISGKVTAGSEGWLKLTTKKEPTDEQLFTSLEETTGNIYVRVKANLGSDTDPKYRTGSLDLFRKDEGGNAHIVFRQKLFDVYTPSLEQAKLRPFTYVGTFHRWNHTGERIIRVDASVAGGGTFNWKAVVISGDFIRLSKTPSLDGGVGVKNFYGEGDNTTKDTDDKVEDLQVTDGSMEITSDNTDYIYFRVGLTGKLSSSASQPRYGLIALIVNYRSANPTTRYIYVRQGEAADYLMGEKDPINNISEPNRPRAVKISPYNLTDPEGKVHSDLSNKQGEFTKYPSQAGYLYQANSRQGWWAYPNSNSGGNPLPEGWDSNSAGKQWDDKFETCPKGYRRPSSGVFDAVEDDEVMNSEMRQSMWLYPQPGQLSNTQNFIAGYLADGYYDRRPMDNKVKWGENNNPSIKEQPTRVGEGANVAYMGVLGFNPRTLASIFFPVNGYYTDTPKGSFQEAGISGGFWTRTRSQTNTNWCVDYGYLFPSEVGLFKDYRVDNYMHNPQQASSVRCVKE